ncbi:putative RNA-directed DNA polymerase [Tanacetum coccineum]
MWSSACSSAHSVCVSIQQHSLLVERLTIGADSVVAPKMYLETCVTPSVLYAAQKSGDQSAYITSRHIRTMCVYLYKYATHRGGMHSGLDMPRSKRARTEKSFGPDFVSFMVENEPTSYREAVTSSEGQQWREAIKSEIESILQNHTWELVDLPPGCKPLGYKWIFKNKMKADGTIDKYKARLVIKGYRQREGLDYFDTYSPVTRITSIRMVLAIAALRNLEVHQMDVKTAFLNGDLEEEIYMNQPEGFIAPGQEGKVCRLVKSLYGLKQAPKQWHQKFDHTMLESGFKINECDKCVYVKDTSSGYVILCLYVDDMLIIGSNDKMIKSTKDMLKSKFDMKDMGLADVILGIKIIRTHNGLVLSQAHYVDKILNTHNAGDSGLARTPIDTSTRPDLAYAVSRLSRYTSNPSVAHWKAMTRVLHYLRYNRDYGLHYDRYPAVIEGYSDANWISDIKDSRSTSGYVSSIAQVVGVILCLNAVAKISHRAQGIAALPSRWHALASCENDMEAMSYAPLPSNAQLTSYLSSYHRRQSFRQPYSPQPNDFSISRLFEISRKGDYYRYFAEFKSGIVKKEAANSLLVAFQLASTTTEADLSPTHHIRLGLTLNFFVFCYKNMNPPERTELLMSKASSNVVIGSVIGSNCKVLAGQPDIDGFLVAVEVESAKHTWDQLAGPSQSTCAQVIHARPDKVNTIEHNAGEDENMDGIAMGKDLEIGVPRNSDKVIELNTNEVTEPKTANNPSQGDLLRKQQKEMLLKVWRGKWGLLVAESGESGGWEEEVRWCHGGGIGRIKDEEEIESLS